MNLERRKLLKTGGGLGLLGLFVSVGLIRPEMALAESGASAFEAKTLEEALNALGVAAPQSGEAVMLTVPEIAEDSAVVPIIVESSLPKTEEIHILVEKNPTPLAASFVMPEGTEGFVATNVKMKETSMVIALVKADGKFYRAGSQVKVTKGGCGG